MCFCSWVRLGTQKLANSLFILGICFIFQHVLLAKQFVDFVASAPANWVLGGLFGTLPHVALKSDIKEVVVKPLFNQTQTAD